MTRSEILQTARPILFNTAMVQAILDGRKTVTRRVIKLRYRDDESGFQVCRNKVNPDDWFVEKVNENGGGFIDRPRYIYPPYTRGDYLYVRETWTKEAGRYYYRADFDSDYLDPCKTLSGGYPIECWYYPGCKGCARTERKIKWCPLIHMPKEAARIFLRVTDVRVERLQDIDDDGAKAEGANFRNGKNVGWEEKMRRTATERFAETWNSTIPKKDLDKYGWEANPWVWVIEFERVEVEP